MVRYQKSGHHLASWDLSLPAKKQTQIKEMIHGERARFDTIFYHTCSDKQRYFLKKLIIA